jgi:hypothetical protein
MQKRAIDHGRHRLEAARAAVEAMEQASTFPPFETAWTNFLTNAAGVYSSLRAAAMGDSDSKAWVERKEGRRKSDELLSYLYGARNAREHGIEQGPKPVDAEAANGPDIIAPLMVELAKVYDARGGSWYDPPTTHLSSPIADPTPLGVATLTLSYLDELLSDAEKYSGHS